MMWAKWSRNIYYHLRDLHRWLFPTNYDVEKDDDEQEENFTEQE